MAQLFPNQHTPKLSATMVASYRKNGVQYIPAYVSAAERADIARAARLKGLTVVNMD